MKLKNAVNLIPLCALLLSACGGGGGGGGTTTPPNTATPSYTIGGTVSGLTGSVVLQNNLSDNYTVSTNGTFTFPTTVTHGNPYSVTVLTQPNGQNCTVSNGSGSATAAISTVAVECVDKTWGTAALIETDNLGSASYPQIAFDANGNALAVWEQADGVAYNIMANRYTAGTGWGTPSLIETDDAGDARYPQIAIDASGNALAVWQQFDGSRDNIWASRYTAGTGWGAAALIETDDSGSAWEPQIAIDANGNALAVWQQFDTMHDNIWANRYIAGTGWGTATLIETDDLGDAWHPQVAIDASGNALAVWQQSDGTTNNIWANRYTAETGWATAALIETDGGDASAWHPQLAFDANGNALAVWEQYDGAVYNIWANRYTAGTGWGTAALIENDNRGDAGSPQIAIDSSGNALAVWWQTDGAVYNVVANRYTAGMGWGTAALIETADVGEVDASQQIAIDANGNGLAVWRQYDGPRINIWATRYTAGTGWGTAALIETDDLGDAANPEITIDADGNALAVWAQSDGTLTNIMSNRFQ